MANFVLVVPKQTLNVLLVSWLSLNDVGRLDSALCDRACREIFEHSLSLRSLGVAADALYESTAFINWVIKRKIKIDTLVIQKKLLKAVNHNLRCQLLEVVGPTLRSVEIKCDRDTKFSSADCKEKNSNVASDGSSGGSSEGSSESDSDSSSGSDSDSSAGSYSDSSTTTSDVKDNIVEMKLIDEAVADLSMHCTKLETFTVLGHHAGSVIALLQKNPTLCSVILSSFSKALQYMNNLCPGVSHIEIREPVSISVLERFALNVPSKLIRLCLPKASVTKRCMQAMLGCASLLELRVGAVPFNWATLNASNPNLEVFRCVLPPSGADSIGIVTQLAASIPNVHTLVMLLGYQASHMTTDIVRAILAGFPALCQFCSESAFESQLAARTLGAPYTVQNENVDSFPLEELFLNSLEYLDFTHTISKCPVLRTVGMSSTSSGATKAAACAAAGVTKIVILSMNYAFTKEYKNFSNLSELDLSLCTHLSDTALVGIAKKCPQLTLLHIVDAPQVTLWAALTVLKLCPHLSSLKIVRKNTSARGETPNRTNDALTELCKAQYPQLQNIYLCFD